MDWGSLFQFTEDGMVAIGRRVYLLNDKNLKGEVMSEAHESKLAMHLGSTKMYHYLKKFY
jgi:hypothetical protein